MVYLRSTLWWIPAVLICFSVTAAADDVDAPAPSPQAVQDEAAATGVCRQKASPTQAECERLAVELLATCAKTTTGAERASCDRAAESQVDVCQSLARANGIAQEADPEEDTLCRDAGKVCAERPAREGDYVDDQPCWNIGAGSMVCDVPAKTICQKGLFFHCYCQTAWHRTTNTCSCTCAH